MGKNVGKQFAAWTAIAAAAGYVMGVLTAPKAGKDSRQGIKDSAAKGVAEAEKQLENVQNELKGLLDDASHQGDKLSKKAKQELEDIAAKASDAKTKTSEVLSALRKGTAEDKELQRALTDAKAAIKHLRSYLTK